MWSSVVSCSPAGRRWFRPASIATLVAFLALWHTRTSGHLPWTALATFVLYVTACLAFGRIFLAATAQLFKSSAGLSWQFLCGFLLFNTLLFILSLISPFGMIANTATLALCVIGFALIFGRRRPTNVDVQDELPSLLCIVVSGLAATMWCSDSQAPLFIQGQTAVFRTWQDTFVHVREISVFANAHGLETIQDIKLSGVRAQIYHFASYTSAAAMSVLTGTPAIEVYSSFQLPMGILLTGLAAYSLAASMFGRWPALAATVAVVLLPDGYQQGFANRYLSYHFLTQVNLGMLYGIACAAIAWIFVLEGCVRGKYLSVIVGYLFLLVTLTYKAHIFVANAFLIMLYPCVFFDRVAWHKRVILGIAFTGLFVSVVALSQTIDRVPVLRLDGSGIGRYILALLSNFDEGVLKTFFTKVFRQEHNSKPVEGLYAIAMLLLSTFGLWILGAPSVAMAAKGRIAPANWFFPMLIVLNYLVMTIGLALDTRAVGGPDELLNRPLVWAYFAVVTWAAAGGYYLAVGDQLPRGRLARVGLIAIVSMSLGGPWFFGRSLQTFPAWTRFKSYETFNAVPLCLVRASYYIRDNSEYGEIIQDSKNDPSFVVTALSERQLFVGNSPFGGKASEQQQRLDVLDTFRRMQEPSEIVAFAASKKISWYLLHPDTQVSWPQSFLGGAVFSCDGYRVFRLSL